MRWTSAWYDSLRLHASSHALLFSLHFLQRAQQSRTRWLLRRKLTANGSRSATLSFALPLPLVGDGDEGEMPFVRISRMGFDALGAESGVLLTGDDAANDSIVDCRWSAGVPG